MNGPRLLRPTCLATLLLLAPWATGAAQPPGRGGLSRLDANGDGILQQNEIPSRAKPIIGNIARRAGLDPNGPLPLDRLTRQARQSERNASGDEREGDRSSEDDNQRRRNEDPDRDNNDDDDDDRRRRDRDEDNRPERRPDALPIKVTGFGSEMSFPKVPGFDVPLSATRQDGPTVAELTEQHDGRIVSYARGLLRRADENDNQIVDPEEWGRLRWRGDPNELDLNRDGRLTLAELTQGIVKTRREREGENGGNRERGDSNGGDSAGNEEQNDRVVEYARRLIREQDRNGNGVIDRDERRGLRGDPARADANDDGVITEQELLSRLRGAAERQRQTAEARDAARQRAREARQSTRSGTDRNRSADRAPAWFRSRDADGDGQVAMHEYSTSWDNRKVAEFVARDTNGDGVIALSEAD